MSDDSRPTRRGAAPSLLALVLVAPFVPAAAAQHDCATAVAVESLPFVDISDSAGAPFSSGAGSCNSAAAVLADRLDNALWYRIAPVETTPVRITVTAPGYDVVSTIWSGPSCEALVEVACRDQPQPNVIRLMLQGGTTYWLSVGDFGIEPGGGATTVQIDVDPDPLPNDVCAGAADVQSLPFAASFDNAGANPSSPAGSCNSNAARQAGVLDNSLWYRFAPEETMEVEVAVEPESPWDPLILLLQGAGCGSLQQVACRDADAAGGRETLRWTAVQGESYWIVLGDHGVLDGGGPGHVTITTPLGACCMNGQNCTMTTGAACVEAGGRFQGPGSACASPGYELAPFSPASLEDIGQTGTLLALGEDDGTVIPIGFSFPFFGQPQTQIGVSADGYLAFDGALDDFLNDPIPSPGGPDGVIAPFWCDLSPQRGGSIRSEVRGTAGLDLRLIVQWTDVPRFGLPDANTFQAVLHEDGDVDFRYGVVTPAPFPSACTIGVERLDGLAGVSVDPAAIGAGLTSVSLSAAMVGVDCTELCLCEFDGAEGVNVFDLLAYLDRWFTEAPRADVDGVPGVDIFDLLTMLDCWFVASADGACG
jgi:hypothetical protein